jgi:hypothetical protein
MVELNGMLDNEFLGEPRPISRVCMASNAP